MADWIDTHAHLSDSKFDSDRIDVIDRAFNAGVAKIVEIADGPSEWEKAKTLAERYPGRLYWAAGIHPYFADQGTDENIARLKTFARHPAFVAFGEIGLDFAKCTIPKDVQRRTFERCLAVARETQKPVIIHCRAGFDDLHPMLQSIKGTDRPGVIHCFSGTAEDAKAVLDLGFFVGVDGPLTYPNAQGLRNLFQTLPLDRILLETDSPYLPPQPHRGERNEPAYLPLIGEKLSELRKMNADKLSLILSRNFHTLFSVSP